MSVILESLTSDFLPFTTNYIMNKLEYNLTQLLNELQTFETISKTRSKVGEANVAQRKPSSSSGRTKRKKKSTGGSGTRPNKAKKAPRAVGRRRTTPRKKFLKENVSIAELMVIGRETALSISPS